jgi:hypothetical protein
MEIQKPIIKYRLRGLQEVRKGRGYSQAELREAGLQNIDIARLNKIPVDILRKTSYQENVEYLRPLIGEILNSRADRKNNNTNTISTSNKRKDQQQKANKGEKKKNMKKVSSTKKRKEKDSNK